MIRVCLADDQTLFRGGLRALLALFQGIEVVAEAEDGEAAVAAVLRHRPDVLLLDVRMPRMDGVQFVQEVRKRPEFAASPILMLTTEGSPELIQRAKAAGAKGWIVKPFKPQQLIAAMQKLTESR